MKFPIALGLVSLALCGCTWGPFTAEVTKDSTHWLGGARTDSNAGGVALWIDKERSCWAAHIEDHKTFGCIEY